jgi:Flp pilus assembly protein TadG
MKRKHHQRGAAALEFGLAFLLFFSIVYGIMEFGRIVGSYNVLSGAVREGVRYAIVHGSASGSPASTTDIENIVRHWAIGLNANSVVVNTTWDPGTGPGSAVKVTASYVVTPFTRLIVRNGVRVQSSSQMTISQ